MRARKRDSTGEEDEEREEEGRRKGEEGEGVGEGEFGTVSSNANLVGYS